MNQNSGQSFKSTLVNQQPEYDKKVVKDRRSQLMRPSLKKKNHKPKWL